jgi:hypothetical protein
MSSHETLHSVGAGKGPQNWIGYSLFIMLGAAGAALGWFVRRDAGVAVGLCIGMIVAAAVWMVWRAPAAIDRDSSRSAQIFEAKPSAMYAKQRAIGADATTASGPVSQGHETQQENRSHQGDHSNAGHQAASGASSVTRAARGRSSGDL